MTPAPMRRTATPWLVGAAVLALAAAGVWTVLRADVAADGQRVEPSRREALRDGEAPRAGRGQPAPNPLLPADGSGAGGAFQSIVDEPEDPARLARFRGRGRLQGTVLTAPSGQSLPIPCEVVLSPMRPFPGGAPPAERSVGIVPGRGDFRFEDVPLGVYELRLRAEGLDSPTLPILLIQPDATDVSVTLLAHATGAIDGRVLDAGGQGAEGLDLVLSGGSGGRQYSTATAGGGTFRFEGVRHGTYALYLGSPQHPLGTPREVDVRAPFTTLPDVVLPPLGELLIEVIDGRGAPAANVPVTGWGEPAGSLSVRTDSHGRALARFLPPGRYRLVVASAQHETAWERTEVRAGERIESRLELTR